LEDWYIRAAWNHDPFGLERAFFMEILRQPLPQQASRSANNVVVAKDSNLFNDTTVYLVGEQFEVVSFARAT
jgi:hypothetical protein